MTHQPFFASIHGPKCPHCQGAMSVHQSVSPGHCGKPACTQAHIAKVARIKTDAIKAKFAAKRRKIRNRNWHVINRAAEHLGVARDDLHVAVVPHQNKPIVKLPEADRKAFEAHLDEIVEAAFARQEEGGAEPVAPVKLLTPSVDEDAVCGACQGSCCVHGRPHHAFLTKWVIARLLQDQPGITRAGAKAYYMDRLPERSVQHNCVYQSETGCTLDRERRGDICNKFQCSQLLEISNHIHKNPDTNLVLLAATPEDRVEKVVAFTLANGTKVLRHRHPAGV